MNKEQEINQYGVRVQYLFVDDITQSKFAEVKEQHKKDIDMFNRSWFERKDDLDDTFIIASGTTYHQSELVPKETEEKLRREESSNSD